MFQDVLEGLVRVGIAGVDAAVLVVEVDREQEGDREQPRYVGAVLALHAAH